MECDVERGMISESGRKPKTRGVRIKGAKKRPSIAETKEQNTQSDVVYYVLREPILFFPAISRYSNLSVPRDLPPNTVVYCCRPFICTRVYL